MRYIGCKKLLLTYIEELLNDKVKGAKSFLDIFSGTATVARYFKKSYKIYSNDVLYFSYCLQRGTIDINEKPTFEYLKKHLGVEDPIVYFNSMDSKEMECLSHSNRFFQNNYSPNGGRMYLTDDNALRIDFVRNKVEEWRSKNFLNEDEYFYLLCSLIEGIPFVSNITGTYGAFRKTWDKRSFKVFQLIEPKIISNNYDNKSFNKDGEEVLDMISGDILYIDPPYNKRQYLTNYHLLETAARYDNPKLKGITGQRAYENKQRSEFCSKKTASSAFERVIQKAKFKYIVVSYSTDGLMSINEIENIMKKYGKKETYELRYINYRRYKSHKKEELKSLNELLFFIEKDIV